MQYIHLTHVHNLLKNLQMSKNIGHSIFKWTNGYQKGYPNHKWIYFNHYLTLVFFKVMQTETIKRLLPIQIAGKAENTGSLQELEVMRILIDW